jgi:hypothetical protein
LLVQDIKRLLTHRADMACGLDYDKVLQHLGFYDTWVAKDINGRPYSKQVTFV